MLLVDSVKPCFIYMEILYSVYPYENILISFDQRNKSSARN